MKPLMLPFQLFGLLPVSLDGQKYDRILLFWSFVVITFNLTITVLSCYNASAIFYNEDDTGKLNDWLKYVTVSFCFYVTLFESVAQRDCLKKNISSFQAARIEFQRHNIPIDGYFKEQNRTYLAQFIFLAVSHVVFLIFEQFFSEDKTLRMKLYTYIMVIPSFTCRLRHLQFAFTIIMCQAVQKTINNALEAVVLSAKRGVYKTERLLFLKLQQSELFETAQSANEIFGWSATFNFAQNFIQITCDMYWIYMNAVEALQVNSRGTYFLMLLSYQLSTISTGLVLVRAASEFYKEQNRTPELIHSIVRRRAIGDCNEMDDVIRHFSLQLRHEKIAFSAHGFFKIDYALMGNVS